MCLFEPEQSDTSYLEDLMGKHRLFQLSSVIRWTLLVVSLLLLAVFGWQWVINDAQPTEPVPNPVIGSGTPSASVLPDAPSATPKPTEPPSASPKPDKTRPFVPERVVVDNVGVRTVQSLPRISVGDNGFSLPNPLDANPLEYAWDREGAKPGSKRGAVNLLAHTYPPGQAALGNQLYDNLQVGDTIVVYGSSSSLRYRVTERVEVPVAGYPQNRVLDTDGPSVMSITICSGERRGPGDWSQRTIWFAEPLK